MLLFELLKRSKRLIAANADPLLATEIFVFRFASETKVDELTTGV